MPQRLGVSRVALLLINSTGQQALVTRTAGRAQIPLSKLSVKTDSFARRNLKSTGSRGDNINSGMNARVRYCHNRFRLVRGCTRDPPSYDAPCEEGGSRNGKYKVFSFLCYHQTTLILFRTAAYHAIQDKMVTVVIPDWMLFRESLPVGLKLRRAWPVSTTRAQMELSQETKNAAVSNSKAVASPVPWFALSMPRHHATRPLHTTLTTHLMVHLIYCTVTSIFLPRSHQWRYL